MSRAGLDRLAVPAPGEARTPGARHWRVLAGLAVGDSVVRSGVLQIKTGDAVKAGQQ